MVIFKLLLARMTGFLFLKVVVPPQSKAIQKYVVIIPENRLVHVASSKTHDSDIFEPVSLIRLMSRQM